MSANTGTVEGIFRTVDVQDGTLTVMLNVLVLEEPVGNCVRYPLTVTVYVLT